MGRVRHRRRAGSATSPASTSSSSAAAPRTSRVAARAPRRARRSASTRRRRSSTTARRMQAQTGIEFPLVEAPAEAVPLPDASFDLAFSDYGASLWADPQKWIAEAARLLRPGGRLVFLTNSTLAHLCTPDATTQPITNSCVRPQFGLYRSRVAGVPRHRVPPLARRLDPRSCARTGSTSTRCTSCRRRADAQTHEYYYVIPAEWARRGRERISGRRSEDVSRTRSPRTSPSGRRRTREHTDANARARVGRTRDPLGRLRDPRGADRRAPATSTGSTSSSSAAAPRTSARGSRAAARASSASTRRRRSSRPRAG